MSDAQASPSSPNLAMIGSKNRSVAWYDPPITTVNPILHDLLENYSHIPSEEVISRIIELRDKIWEVYPYPCIGQFRFLDLSLVRNPAYQTILHRLTHDGDRILDVGCCLAPDLRKLAHDGVPPSSMYGLEMHSEYISMGYDFFNDKDSFADANFIIGDLLDSENEEIRAVKGTFGIVNLSMFLHLWDFNGQVRACKRVVELLRDEKGVLIVGQSVGDVVGREVTAGKRVIFKHNVETFKKMWKEVGEKMGTEWKVGAWLRDGMGIDGQTSKHWDEPGAKRLSFTVERVA
ncbi:hypothetical protein QBC34DRAFT_113536 [Podospora aff. communis PSN243]|uniref:Methyltransferase domain-containing protein n=1 Tax=Podospora aff. communis PSN243 TaxID=3040156 RepID=A0AAV9GP24_9PEZI|nr:hypothetical protein QBC34DRAFT_113536 [Podospora aff. communis PSN243]